MGSIINKKALIPKGVFLRNNTVFAKSEFDDCLIAGEEILPLYRGGPVDGFTIYKDDSEDLETIRFEYFCGAALVEPEHCDDVLNGEDGCEDFILLEITAKFYSIYLMEDPDISENCLEEFHKFNVGYHVWPYWREFAQSMTARMGAPIISIPMYSVSRNKEKDDD